MMLLELSPSLVLGGLGEAMRPRVPRHVKMLQLHEISPRRNQCQLRALYSVVKTF